MARKTRSAPKAKLGIAKWFRGTSTFQIKAADDLQNALRDDVEQNTTHRIRAVMQSLGLEPPMKTRLLRGVMKMSKCNDLAFLFGIMTVFYKKNKTGKGYSLNEQIIMSTIAHLDMIATLRELDRILPPGHISKKQQEILDKIEARRVRAIKKAMRPRKPKVPAISPYFEKLVRPKFHSTNLGCKMPDITTSSIPYERYLDPHYKIPNSNRWFATYSLRPSERIVRAIIDEEIDKIFCDFECMLQRANNMEIICEYHFQEYLNERRRQNERFVKTRELLGGSILPSKIQGEKRKKYIIERLHKDIEANIGKIRKRQKNKIFKVKLLSGKSDVCEKLVEVGTTEPFMKTMTSDFPPFSPVPSYADVPGHYLRPCPCSSKKCKEITRYITPSCVCNAPDPSAQKALLKEQTCKKKKTKGSGKGKDKDKGKDTDKDKDQDTGRGPGPGPLPDLNKKQGPRYPSGAANRLKAGKDSNRLEGGEVKLKCTPFHVPGRRVISNPCKRLCNQGNLVENFFSRLLEDSDDDTNKNRSEYGRTSLLNDDVSPKQSKIFFRAATKHTPYTFEYERVYKFSSTSITTKVKKMFVDVLDEEHIVPREWEGHPNVIGAAAYNFHKLFKEGVAEKTKEIEEKEQEKKAEEEIPVSDPDYAPKMFRKKYSQTYFDANNLKLMDQMLKDALNLMKKNPYYVLASLPECHKLPVLREWIYRRYGKVYTKEDRLEFLKQAQEEFSKIAARTMNVQFPDNKEVKVPRNMTYKQRDELMTKFNEIQKTVMDDMDEKLMKTSRDFWFALRPYILPKGPPRNTYYAYMPARVRDIQHFRLWQPGEYRDYKQFRQRREQIEAAKARGEA